MDEKQELEERVQALSEKVEKLDWIVYRLWRDLKAVVNDIHRQPEA
jgi:archaellum component FlaC